MSTMTSSDDQEVAKLSESLGPLLSYTGVVSVYLFGSFASGRSHRESDIDIGVVLDRAVFQDAPSRSRERLRLSGELLSATGGRKVDVVVLNDAPATFASRVVTTGRRLSCTDDEADHIFRRDSQLRAADLEPFLRRTRRRKLEALAR